MSDYRSRLRPPQRARRSSSPPAPAAAVQQGESFQTRDGRSLLLRAIHPDDAESLRRAFARMTPEQVRMRVFHALTELPEPVARQLCAVDPEKVAAFVVTDADGSEIRAEARVHFDSVTEAAEFAIAVDPAFVGQGLGLRLMTRLLATARERGMREIWGDVLVENTPMLALSDHLGFERTADPGDPGLLRLSLLLDPPVQGRKKQRGAKSRN